MVDQWVKSDIRRVLIYKRTHEGDPNPDQGVFGNNGCMGRVRSWNYDAVIGVGGVRPWPEYRGIAGKLNWIGIGPNKVGPKEDDLKVTFEHFKYVGVKGPELTEIAPHLARRLFGTDGKGPARLLVVERSETDLWSDVERIVRPVTKSGPSKKEVAQRVTGMAPCYKNPRTK